MLVRYTCVCFCSIIRILYLKLKIRVMTLDFLGYIYIYVVLGFGLKISPTNNHSTTSVQGDTSIYIKEINAAICYYIVKHAQDFFHFKRRPIIVVN